MPKPTMTVEYSLLSAYDVVFIAHTLSDAYGITFSQALVFITDCEGLVLDAGIHPQYVTLREVLLAYRIIEQMDCELNADCLVKYAGTDVHPFFVVVDAVHAHKHNDEVLDG